MTEKIYIGTKVIAAEPMGCEEFCVTEKQQSYGITGNIPGYRVRYEDGYVSWSPKKVFERCYREVSNAERTLFFTFIVDKEKF